MHLDGYSLFSWWANRRNNGICDVRYLWCSLPVVRLQAFLLTSHLCGGLSGAWAFGAWQTAHSSALLLRTVSLLPAQAILLTLVLLLLLVPLYTFPFIHRSNQSSYFYYKPPPKPFLENLKDCSPCWCPENVTTWSWGVQVWVPTLPSEDNWWCPSLSPGTRGTCEWAQTPAMWLGMSKAPNSKQSQQPPSMKQPRTPAKQAVWRACVWALKLCGHRWEQEYKCLPLAEVVLQHRLYINSNCYVD